MAERENIKDRIRRINPSALPLVEAIDRALLDDGYRGAIVTTTEDMTADEHHMALFEGFLKEGYPPEEADRLASEWTETLLLRLNRR